MVCLRKDLVSKCAPLNLLGVARNITPVIRHIVEFFIMGVATLIKKEIIIIRRMVHSYTACGFQN